MITGVAVVVPARDEEDHIASCLRGLRQAFSVVPQSVRTRLSVILDHCQDRTAAVVRAEAPDAEILVNRRPCPLGTLRDWGARRTFSALGTPASRTWLLNTDADSVVPRDWILAHLRHAALGAQGVAGLAEVTDWTAHDEGTRRRYLELAAERVYGDSHGHVYGANLGVRADVYRRVGGFPPVSTGEDRGLWTRLEAAGYRLMAPCAAPVSTSSRRCGRATGGVADLLNTMRQDTAV